MNIIFLDTETTDNSEEAMLVQLAYKQINSHSIENLLFKPMVPIELGAMAVHHITNKAVEEKPLFREYKHYEKIKNELESGVIVAHNAPFDLRVLRNEGIDCVRYIDTLKVAQHLIQDSDKHSLQYLRYFLDLNIDLKNLAPHDAEADVIVLEALYAHLVGKIADHVNSSSEVVDKMIDLTHSPVRLKKIMFGKYFGKTFEEISKIDSGYLDWISKQQIQKKTNNTLDEQGKNLLYTLSFYL